MSKCPVCEHAKTQAIDAAISHGRLLGVVATQFRVKKADLINHVKHAPIQAPAETHAPMLSAGGIAQYLDRPSLHVTENPLSQFKHAWGLAKDDRTMRQQMVDWLNQQLQADDMGLP